MFFPITKDYIGYNPIHRECKLFCVQMLYENTPVIYRPTSRKKSWPSQVSTISVQKQRRKLSDCLALQIIRAMMTIRALTLGYVHRSLNFLNISYYPGITKSCCYCR